MAGSITIDEVITEASDKENMQKDKVPKSYLDTLLEAEKEIVTNFQSFVDEMERNTQDRCYKVIRSMTIIMMLQSYNYVQ